MFCLLAQAILQELQTFKEEFHHHKTESNLRLDRAEVDLEEKTIRHERAELDLAEKTIELNEVKRELDHLKAEDAKRTAVYLYCEYSKRAMEGQSLSSGLESYLRGALILFATALLGALYDSSTQLFTTAELVWVKRTYKTSKYHYFYTTPF